MTGRMLVVMVVVAAMAAAAGSAGAGVQGQVWPEPRRLIAHGELLPIAAHLVVNTESTSPRLDQMIQRWREQLPTQANGVISTLDLVVHSTDDALTEATDETYTISFSGDERIVRAKTIYGARHALETLTQLAASNNGTFPTHVHVVDEPDFAWRGLMLDTGRRFFPLSTVKNILDTMAAVKLNVLHFHASDFCRFSVESKLYPNLTQALTGIMAGHYSQADIASLQDYAKTRGIRVVPEFDVPGHSRGFLPIEGDVVFCSEKQQRSQLYNDPKGKTLATLRALLKEMAGLFNDSVFNMGSDETRARGVCDANSTFDLERTLLQYIHQDLGKSPAGWEEVLFDNGAATHATIIDTWSRHNPSEVTTTGRKAINSASGHFYFTKPAPGGPAGWSKCWTDIASGIPTSQRHLLLGGEISMWTDLYCYERQCGAAGPGPTPPGSVLFDPKYDAVFEKSVGGMMFPRGFVAAGSFWHYNASVNASSSEFVQTIWQLNDQLRKRGANTCPSKCSCDFLTACGKPYLPSAPTLSSSITLQECPATTDVTQSFAVKMLQDRVAPRFNRSICLHASEAVSRPQLIACSEGSKTIVTYNRETSEISSTLASGRASTKRMCLTGEAKGDVFFRPCASDLGYHSARQHWAYSDMHGTISLHATGLCLAFSQA